MSEGRYKFRVGDKARVAVYSDPWDGKVGRIVGHHINHGHPCYQVRVSEATIPATYYEDELELVEVIGGVARLVGTSRPVSGRFRVPGGQRIRRASDRFAIVRMHRPGTWRVIAPEPTI